jgi:CheY-like chemotaxis protein
MVGLVTEIKEPPRRVILAEDNETDVFFVERAVKKLGLSWKLEVAHDGQEAIELLSRLDGEAQGQAAPEARPSLVLLDLKMPRRSGFDVLAWLNGKPQLNDVPVVVLTTSAEESDEADALAMGANFFETKPYSVEGYVKLVRKVHQHWLE